MGVGGGFVKPTTGTFRNLEVGDIITDGVLYFQFPDNLGEMIRDGVIDDSYWDPTIGFSGSDADVLMMGAQDYSWGFGMYVTIGNLQQLQEGMTGSDIYTAEIENSGTEWYISNSDHYQFSATPITVTSVNKNHALYQWIFLHEEKTPLKIYQGTKELSSIKIGNKNIKHVYLGNKQIF